MTTLATLYVMPAAGRLVRDPKTKEALPAAGKRVARTPYWLRRLADKDVIEVPDPQETKGAMSEAKAPAKAAAATQDAKAPAKAGAKS